MKMFNKDLINWAGLKDVDPEKAKDTVLDAAAAAVKRLVSDINGMKMVGVEPAFMGTPPVIEVHSDTLHAPDKGYEVLFDEVDMRASSSDTFEILGISGGARFYQMKRGDKAELSRLPEGDMANVKYLRFTGGFAILDDWLRFNQHYKIDELIRDTTIRWYEQKAELFYGLLTAMDSSINLAFDESLGNTVDKACAQILMDLKAEGYAVSDGAGFYITVNPMKKRAVIKALAARFDSPNSNADEISANIKGVISSVHYPADSFMVSLAGHKNKRGEWEDLNTRPPQRDELSLGADHVWTGAYNGAIAEPKQHRRCAWS
jgi:hypothetical protein